MWNACERPSWHCWIIIALGPSLGKDVLFVFSPNTCGCVWVCVCGCVWVRVGVRVRLNEVCLSWEDVCGERVGQTFGENVQHPVVQCEEHLESLQYACWKHCRILLCRNM